MTSDENGWALEVVRGLEAGRVFALRPGPSVLGNALEGEPGIDLGGQEGASPRRMAGKQASLESSPAGLTVRDLDSPGGTFVNRQRLLPGQSRRLEPGDLIQLGGLQLRVVSRTAAAPKETVPTASPPPARPKQAVPTASPPPARPKETVPTASPPTAAKVLGLKAPFLLATGAACRTWDDFFTVSAQNWGALRDEMTSGRLATFLSSIGRDELRPMTGAGKSPDETLDDWLGRLPTTRSVEPDLEVHPPLIRVRALPGGGLTRTKVIVTSTGYRLLRSTMRVEPPGDTWLRVAPAFAGVPFTTAESTEIALDVLIPESLSAPMSGFVTVTSNGGTRRVEVRVEPAAKTDVPPGPVAGGRDGTGGNLLAALGARSSRERVVMGALGAVLLRALIAVGDLVPGLSGEGVARPSLAGAGVVLGVIGAVAASRFAVRRGEPRDLPPAAFAGAVGGLLVAAVAVAACRSFEPFADRGFAVSGVSGCVLWAAIGALAGEGSRWFVPHHPAKGKGP